MIVLLDDFKGSISDGSIRDQVRELIPVNQLLRDLGRSVLRRPDSASARSRILIYLQMNVGEVVAGEELMVVAGISEYARRIRELRVEQGWPVISGVTAAEITDDPEDDQDVPRMRTDDYMLLRDEKDSEGAVRWKTAKKIRNEKIGARDKLIKFFRVNVGQLITGEELRYVAEISDWPRRIRELRTELGWPIATSITGRPDLPVGAYVLERDHQSPPHDRKIKDSVRRKVLQRDGHRCQDCEWHHDLWNPSDPRHLEVHHLKGHAKGGPNTEENLLTLCNICHDDRHGTENSADE